MSMVSMRTVSPTSSGTLSTRRRLMPLRRIFVAVVVILSLGPRSAAADAFTYSFTVDLTQIPVTDTVSGQKEIHIRMSFDSIDLFAGDTFHLDGAFAPNQMLRMRDVNPVGGDEKAFFGFASSITVASDVTASIAFTGVQGDLLINPLNDVVLEQNLTDSAFSFTSFTLDWTSQNPVIPNSAVRSGAIAVGLTFIADDIAAIDTSQVPDASSLALLALGLTAALRRSATRPSPKIRQGGDPAIT